MIKEILQKRLFWVILVILLLAVFVYPPFMVKAQYYIFMRSWGWLFSPPVKMEIDFKTLFVEAIIAILLSIGICLIPFRKIGMLLGFIWSGIKESSKEEPKD
jgi:hypothetical protein